MFFSSKKKTLKQKILSKKSNLLFLALAVCSLVASLGSPGPALLTARTLN